MKFLENSNKKKWRTEVRRNMGTYSIVEVLSWDVAQGEFDTVLGFR